MSEAQARATEREYINLSDVGQYEEDELAGFQGGKDANAQREPLPHENYVFRVAYAEFWPSKAEEEKIPLNSDPNNRWEKRLAPSNGTAYYMTHVIVTTENNVDESKNGYSWTEMISTFVNKGGTCAAQALCQGLGVDTIAMKSHIDLARALDQFLAGDGTLVGAESDWIARQFDKEALQVDKQGQPKVDPATGQQLKGVETFRLRGMRKFPKNEDGTHRNVLTAADFPGKIVQNADEAEVTEVRAFNEIRRWIPVDRLMSAGQGADGVGAALADAIADPKSKVATTAPPKPAPATARVPAATTQPPAAVRQPATAAARPGTGAVRRVAQ